MKGVLTLGNGGYEKLSYQDLPIPELSAGEVLVKVLAAGVNNTEINTRLGWYSSSVSGSTEEFAENNSDSETLSDGGWSEATPFPFVQGTDCCGRVVATADDVDSERLGQRVIVRACMRLSGFDSLQCVWMASDFDGAFAQYVKVPASEAFQIDSAWSDAELATIPCAYGTAENMLHRCTVKAGETVLVTGASGGVGSAVVQLARRREAKVIAITAAAKVAALRKLGAEVIERGSDLLDDLGISSVDVVIDNVAGEGFAPLLKVLKPGGRYASSGAIAGPIVSFDMRDFYLKNILMVGCTAWHETVFPHLISYIENEEIQPLLAKIFPLAEMVDAQKEFLQKQHVGNFVLIPPRD